MVVVRIMNLLGINYNFLQVWQSERFLVAKVVSTAYFTYCMCMFASMSL